MRRMILSIGFVTLVSLGCRSEPAKSPDGAAPGRAASAPVSAPGGTAAAAPVAGVLPDPGCGRDPRDWCAAPAGDPCGAHKDVDSCRADPACRGRKFHGEGTECKTDERGFGIGCPTVGCLSR